MKLKTLIQNSTCLEVAEVEIELMPGIPQIHFLGLPDRIIKESFYRIKSALKNSGYKFPLTKQVIVNIKPNHLRKSSRGLELAVALGILLKTGQIPDDRINTDWVLYGELGLDGQIYEPTDLAPNIGNFQQVRVLTGLGEGAADYRLVHLNSIAITHVERKNKISRPAIALERYYSEQEAEFIFLAATTGLHSLLVGDTGAGKTTLARSFSAFLPEPANRDVYGYVQGWYPVAEPHHSVTPAAFLGGGGQLYGGELERARGGILLLDELLEFSADVIEVLRVPMSEQKLRLSRGGSYRDVQTDFQVLATSNLCPCGKWTPSKKDFSCRFSRKKCTRYLERISGPVLDRFALLLIYESPVTKRTVKGRDILERIQRVSPHMQSQVDVAVQTPPLLEDYYSGISTRRRQYLDRVAAVYAYERSAQGSSGKAPLKLSIEDYRRAERWVTGPSLELEKGIS